MESINYGLYDWNRNQRIYYAPDLRIMLGLPPQLLKPEDWSKRIHPSDWPMFRRKLIEHLKGETPRFVCDVRYRTEDGTWRWARQHGIAFRGPDGRARRLVGAAGDITEIKQREFELQTRTGARASSFPSTALDQSDLESRYALALESISVGAGAYDINLDTGMVYLAPRWSKCSTSPNTAGQRVRRRRASRRPAAAHAHDRRALQGRDSAA
jgi:PAS domain S-box-containing protein